MKDWICSQCGEWHSDHPSQDETKHRQWDEGEHEGCGIDSQRAVERQTKASDLVERLCRLGMLKLEGHMLLTEDEQLACADAVKEIENIRAKLVAAEAMAHNEIEIKREFYQDLIAAESRLRIMREVLEKVMPELRYALQFLTEGVGND